MHTAVYIYCALALGVCVLTYVLQLAGRLVVPALLIPLIIGKLVLALLSPIYVLIWYLIDAESCKAAYAQHEAMRSQNKRS